MDIKQKIATIAFALGMLLLGIGMIQDKFDTPETTPESTKTNIEQKHHLYYRRWHGA